VRSEVPARPRSRPELRRQLDRVGKPHWSADREVVDGITLATGARREGGASDRGTPRGGEPAVRPGGPPPRKEGFGRERLRRASLGAAHHSAGNGLRARA